VTESYWSNEEMERKRATEEARLFLKKYSASPMSDEEIAKTKWWTQKMADGGDYDNHPCEYWYAEIILDLIARIDELKRAPG
jgi:hypothetical protein